jgi:G3E family GTPase
MLAQPVPVTILTGFLGSGKTTVLNRLLRRDELSDTIVIINEFGEIGLDHLLVERSDEQLTLLRNGCLCCTVRGDLVSALADLDARRSRGDIGAYRRVVIETTGLADPAPILHTLIADPAIAPRYRLEGVVTTVDAVNGASTLSSHEEAMKQVAVADRILLTKSDLAGDRAAADLRDALMQLNPGAPIVVTTDGAVEPSTLFSIGFYDADGKPDEVRRWLQDEAYRDEARHGRHAHHDHHVHHHHAHDVNRHDARIAAHCIVLDAPVRWEPFSYWLECLAAVRGEELLRLKGIVAIEEDPERPLVIHAVQHVFHPPVRLDRWPSADRRTRLVLIVRDLPRSLIEDTMRKFAKLT